MEKLKMHTTNITNENYEWFAARFPNCITETIDEHGEIIRAIDKDVLMQEMNTHVVEGREERYQFTWPDKKKSILLANSPINAALRPCREESVDFDTTENLYIEGDNLDVLKLLRETYLGKVKMIYIDPPYNTGNDFVYEDDFSDDGHEFLDRDEQYDEHGNRMVKNLDSNGRFHTNWLNMMLPRLKVARDLLSEDGVIFISIDDNEVHHLKKICDDVFGKVNFIAECIWINNERGRSIDKHISNTNEFILMYSKDLNNLLINMKKETDPIFLSKYTLIDEKSQYKKGDPLFNNNSKFNIETRPNLVYSIYVNKITGEKRCIDEKFKNNDNKWVLDLKNNFGSEWIKIVPPLRNTNGLIGCWRWGVSKFMEENESELILHKENNGKYMFYSKNRLTSDGEKFLKYKNVITGISSVSGTSEIVKILNGKFFDYPKPSNLIKLLIDMSTLKNNNNVVLDFFSGSATTAHAVMQLNAEDGGKRKFIMVQIPESTDEKSEAYKAGYKNICEIGKERIRRAGQKIKDELVAGQARQRREQQASSTTKSNNDNFDLDIGFRVLKLDSSNMKDVYYTPDDTLSLQDMQLSLDAFSDSIKPDRSGEDLLFQVMLDLGVPLSAKITQKNNIFYVDDHYLIASFGGIDTEQITDIAKAKPYYAVFRDSCFANDAALVNLEQIFNTYSPDTIRKVL